MLTCVRVRICVYRMCLNMTHINIITCIPAEIPCTVKNSNGKPGRDCACASGYNGVVTWVDGVSVGTCNPTKCTGSQADAPINGRVDLSDGVNHGSIAVFYCNDGCTQTGVRSIVCDAKDQDTSWPEPSERPTCTPIPTTTPTTITTSLRILPTDGTTTIKIVGSLVSDTKEDDEEDPMFSLDDMVIVAGSTAGGVFILLVGIIILTTVVFFFRRNDQRVSPVTYPRPKSPTSPESHVDSIELVELDNTTNDTKNQDVLLQSSENVEVVEHCIEVVEVDQITNVHGLYLDPLTSVLSSEDGDVNSPTYGLT